MKKEGARPPAAEQRAHESKPKGKTKKRRVSQAAPTGDEAARHFGGGDLSGSTSPSAVAKRRFEAASA